MTTVPYSRETLHLFVQQLLAAYPADHPMRAIVSSDVIDALGELIEGVSEQAVAAEREACEQALVGIANALPWDASDDSYDAWKNALVAGITAIRARSKVQP